MNVHSLILSPKAMAASSLSGTFLSSLINQQQQLTAGNIPSAGRTKASNLPVVRSCSCAQSVANRDGSCRRRLVLAGTAAMATSLLFTTKATADEVPENYQAFVDYIDGYSYYYPSDWRDFNYTGHDSAFKDRSLQLQNVRVSFKPTDKTDVHELGSMDEVIDHLVNDVYSTPTQTAKIFNMEERSIDGTNYWTFEYDLSSPNFSRTAFTTIAIGNGRCYTLTVGANERRWYKFRNKLKVVADSFKLINI